MNGAGKSRKEEGLPKKHFGIGHNGTFRVGWLDARHWKEFLKSHLSNLMSDREGLFFLLRNERGKSRARSNEADMKVWKLPLQNLDMVMTGKITDSLSVMGTKASKMLNL